MNNHTMHPHPTRHDVTVHMNAMMPIHISNSNGSYTIIFHIIQTIMLTHQLTCINISFSIHISSHPMQAITCKQNTWTNFSPTINPNFLTVRGLSKDSPSSNVDSTYLEPECMAISGLTTPKTIFMSFYTKNIQVEEDPYLPEFVETPQYRYPRIALAVGVNFAFCLAGIRQIDHGKI